MLKIAHLVTGFVALLLSAVPSLSTSFLNTPDAIYLAFTGLLNLLLASQQTFNLNNTRQQLQSVASALLVIAAIVQSLILLAPLPNIGGYPAVWLPLVVVVVAIVLQLLSQLPSQARQYDQRNSLQTSHPFSQGKRETGTVKWFNISKGFGFISRDSGEDIFVHFRAIQGEGHQTLTEDQRVEFSVVQRDKGLQAEDVIVIPSHR